MLKTDEIIRYLKLNKDFFENKYNIEKIAIFGSFAKGKQNEKSDIDLIYYLKKDKNISYFNLYELEKN